jgi:hypothetical protein
MINKITTTTMSANPKPEPCLTGGYAGPQAGNGGEQHGSKYGVEG